MTYTITAHPTMYNDVLFRSRLEARWAALFDLLGWEWEYEPIDLVGWTPDFRVVVPCPHRGHHTCLAEVKPFTSEEEWTNHPIMRFWNDKRITCTKGANKCKQCENYPDGHLTESEECYARLGLNPGNSTFWLNCKGPRQFEFVDNVYYQQKPVIVRSVKELWDEAGNITRYQPTPSPHVTPAHKKPQEVCKCKWNCICGISRRRFGLAL